MPRFVVCPRSVIALVFDIGRLFSQTFLVCSCKKAISSQLSAVSLLLPAYTVLFNLPHFVVYPHAGIALVFHIGRLYS